jgi:hypothetical protein
MLTAPAADADDATKSACSDWLKEVQAYVLYLQKQLAALSAATEAGDSWLNLAHEMRVSFQDVVSEVKNSGVTVSALPSALQLPTVCLTALLVATCRWTVPAARRRPAGERGEWCARRACRTATGPSASRSRRAMPASVGGARRACFVEEPSFVSAWSNACIMASDGVPCTATHIGHCLLGPIQLVSVRCWTLVIRPARVRPVSVIPCYIGPSLKLCLRAMRRGFVACTPAALLID